MSTSSKSHEFQVGDLVWAKMKGFPPWPGRISEPTKEMKKTPKKNSNIHCIYFFGSNNYGWIEVVNIKPYLEFKDDLTKTCKTASFRDACNAIEEYRLKGDNSLPVESTSPEEDAFDKLFSPPPTPKTAKVKSKRSGSLPSSGKSKEEKPEEEKPKKSVNTSITGSGKKNKPSIKRSPPTNESLPQKKKKKLSSESNSISNHTGPLISSTPRDNIDRIPRYSPKSEPIDLEQASQRLKDKNVIASSLKFGFLGLGIMGSGIVKNLLKSGHKVTVWNRSPDKVQRFAEAGADVGKSPAEVVEVSDVTFSCVSDPVAAKLCVFGPSGVVNSIDVTKCYVELSTIDTETSLDIADAICSKGGHYLEAQLQGSKTEAEDGQLIILCAGDREVYDKCQSCFEAFGHSSFFLGDIGSAVKMNLVIQLISGVTLGALAEGMALADRAGLQQTDVLEILNLTSIQCPLLTTKAKAIIDSYFATSMPLRHLQKDLSLTLSLGDILEHPLPLTAAANEVYKHARRLGYADHDSSAVYIRARF